MQKIVWILVAIVGALTAISSIIARDDASMAIPALLLGLIGGGIYFIPAFIAAKRSHPNATAIVVLNALAGWTFLGWIGSLVWALLRIKPEGSTQ